MELPFLTPLISKSQKVLVACSGGVDSVVLAHYLHVSQIDFALAHCHFNLRGDAANADQELVAQLAKEWQVPFYTTQFETTQYATSKGISIQMAARDLRYLWLEKIRSQHQFDKIAVGTNLSDAIETYVFNSVKGTGIAGLRGIKAVNGHLIRPLLQATKEEIYTYAKAQQLQWREDASNASTKYARNKIRHEVIPALTEINPNLAGTFLRTFERLQQLENYVNANFEADWKAISSATKNTLSISILGTTQLTEPELVLYYGLKPYGFTETQVKNLVQACAKVGATFTSDTHEIHVDRTHILVSKINATRDTNTYLIHEFLGEIQQPLALQFSDDFVHGKPDFNHPNKVFFDFNALTFPLTLRKWKEGDKIKPLGMKGAKKVSDLLIDAKIPLPQKQKIWVLESNQEIIWVIGIRTSETHKITPKTTRIYSIEILPHE